MKIITRYWFRQGYTPMRIFRNRQTPIFWWTCAFLNGEYLVGILIILTIGTAYGIHLRMGERNYIGYFIRNENRL